MQVTLLRLNEIVKQRDLIQGDPGLDAMEKTEKVRIPAEVVSTAGVQIKLINTEIKFASLYPASIGKPGAILNACFGRFLEDPNLRVHKQIKFF